jgi:vancomycin resistance protein YoaR
MTTTTFRKPVDLTQIILQALMAILGGLVIFGAIIGSSFIVFNIMYWGRIFPGVSVAGINLSGMGIKEAELKLNQAVTYPYNGKILLTDGDKLWVAAPIQMGMVFDPASTARKAFRLGRSDGIFNSLANQVRTLQSGVEVAPVMVLDERTGYEFIQAIAAQIDQPVVEATLQINGTDVISTPGQVGRLINVDKTLALVSNQMQSFTDGEVKLVVEERAPDIMDTSKPAEVARNILAKPLTLVLPNATESDLGPWTINPQDLAAMLVIERVPDGNQNAYRISISQFALRPILTEIAGKVDRKPENARFTFNDSTHQLDLLKPSITGYTVKVDESLASINDAINKGEQVITLSANINEPPVTSSDTAESLGITQNIITYSTYFRGSSTPRIQNIETASAQFHGLLVAPGETFSMGDALGDVSLDNGYAEAMIIYDGRTVKGVGGGVCQVSTTLFRTAFFAGFPIAERNAHAYRVSYYEENETGIDRRLAGLDATVYFPLVDFKFVNDTPYWLLMETYVNESAHRLTWKFYSTSDGRTVNWDTTGPTNIVSAPPPQFIENPDLPPGDMRQTDWAADGADVDVTRTVSRGGAVYLQDEFRTHYEAWQAVCEYNAVDDLTGTAAFRGICQQ